MQSALKSVEKTGPPKSPIGFLGKRKHNGAVSFSARKTMSGVCADEVAVSFSAVNLAYRLTLSNSASCYKTNIVPTEKFTLLQLNPRVKLTDSSA